MELFIDSEGNYPKYPGDVLKINPSWTSGKPLPTGWSLVLETPRPEQPVGQYLHEAYPELIDGIFVQTWVLTEYSQSEMEQLSTKNSSDLYLDKLEIDQATREALLRRLF